jgi:hypothetical protein
MVLHVWTEPDERMRVRITRTAEPGSGESATTYASTKSQLVEAVEEWLDSLGAPR